MRFNNLSWEKRFGNPKPGFFWVEHLLLPLPSDDRGHRFERLSAVLVVMLFVIKVGSLKGEGYRMPLIFSRPLVVVGSSLTSN